jgi:hypothetical protein
MKRIAKALVAYLASTVATVGTWLGTLAPGPITGREWATLIAALVGPLLVGGAVYRVPNARPGV